MRSTEPETQNSVGGEVSPAGIVDALRGATREPFNWLLLAMPVAVGLEVFHASALWKFLVSGLAVIPLAGLMGRATENLAETLTETFEHCAGARPRTSFRPKQYRPGGRDALTGGDPLSSSRGLRAPWLRNRWAQGAWISLE